MMADDRVMKMLHPHAGTLAFFHLGEHLIPTPMFDTQVGAMALGLGDSIAYDSLVRSFLKFDRQGTALPDWSVGR